MLRRRLNTLPLAGVVVVAILAAVGGSWLGARLVSQAQRPGGSLTSLRPVAAAGSPSSSLVPAAPPKATVPTTLLPQAVPSALSAPPSASALIDQCTPADVDIYFTSSKGSYARGETVWLSIWAVNHSGRDCEMPYDSCADRIVITEDATGTTAWDENPPAGQPCYSKPTMLLAGATSGTAGTSWTDNASPGRYHARAHWLVDLVASFSIT